VVATGGLITFWLLNKVVSTVLTLGLLAGVLYVVYKANSSSGSSSSSNSSSSDVRADGGDDPLAAARRIMDKYK
jgi:TATA-binding protein-associated factor